MSSRSEKTWPAVIGCGTQGRVHLDVMRWLGPELAHVVGLCDLSDERLAEQIEEIAVLNEELAPFRILTGMEVDILDDGRLDLPDDWRVKLDRGWGMPFMFDAVVWGGKGDSQDPLAFSIEGLGLDDIGNEFGVLITGLDLGGGECGHSKNGHHGHCGKGSAFFYGGGEPSPIPIPAALWLFGSGLLGLVALARRRTA